MARVEIATASPHALVDAERARTARGLLSEDELARVNRLRFAADQRATVAARALLRRLLSFHLGVEPTRLALERTDLGKPRLAWPEAALEFSVTHTRDLVAVAISQVRVGIDAEPHSRDLAVDELASALTREERESVELAAEPRARLLELWTAKEALSKAIGLGLHAPLRSIRPRASTFELAPPLANGAWSLVHLSCAGHALAVVAEADSIELERSRAIATDRDPLS